VNQRQRIVVVIGLGLALGVVGEWVTNWDNGSFGWVGYAPLSRATFGPDTGLHSWVRFLIWLVLAVLWTAISVWLLRSSEHQPGGS
jgi:heme/copper-type cytochrome/quinol oxidase subunit 1